jgi:hypothetical protein
MTVALFSAGTASARNNATVTDRRYKELISGRND